MNGEPKREPSPVSAASVEIKSPLRGRQYHSQGWQTGPLTQASKESLQGKGVSDRTKLKSQGVMYHKFYKYECFLDLSSTEA